MCRNVEETQPVAKKDHRCYLCGLTIQKGIVYVRRFCFDDGPFAAKMHLACEELTREWDRFSWEEHDEGEFRRILKECPGHDRGGQGEKCCERAGEYNGFGSDGPTKFTCPKHCSCHD